MPINYLPPELLAQIFTFGTESELEEEEGAWEDQDDEEENVFEAMLGLESESAQLIPGQQNEPANPVSSRPNIEFPTLVSHVCRTWRAVALATPNLWTTLEFSEGPPFEKSKAWIERSKDCDLDITIDNADGEDQELHSLADVQRVLELIAPHVRRWRSFAMFVDHWEEMRLAMFNYLYVIGPAPRLRGMTLCHYGPDDSHSHSDEEKLDELGAFFSGVAPLLSEVTFWGVHVRWGKSVSILQGLEVLEMAYHDQITQPKWPDFYELLKASPNLKELTLLDSCPEPFDDVQREVLKMPHLRRIALNIQQPLDVFFIFKVLDVPALRELELGLDPAETSDDLMEYLLSRRNCIEQLQELSLSGLRLEDDSPRHIVNLYAKLSSLVSLRLSFVRMGHRTLQLLYEGNSLRLPRLTKLIVVSLDQPQLLRDLVRIRKEKGVPLEKLTLRKWDSFGDEDFAYLKAHVGHLQLDEDLSEDYGDEEMVDDDDDDDEDEDEEDALFNAMELEII